MARDRRRFTVGCLFAAIGGFCRAFQECGATVLWANEKDHFARDTFVENFPEVRHLCKPVEDLTVAVDELEPVDVITAGFPCQPFSVAGEKRGLKDERGLLFLHIIRLLREFGKSKPKVLLLENVQHFRNHDKGRTFRRVQSEIQKAGYWFSDRDARILSTAKHTDIPQNRDRIFMVAFSCDHFASNTYEFPEPLPEGSLRKVKAFLDLDRKADPVLYFKPGSQYHPMFVEAMAKGGRDSVYQLRRSYVRENMSRMCFTLMANMGDGGHNIPVIKDRWGIRKLDRTRKPMQPDDGRPGDGDLETEQAGSGTGSGGGDGGGSNDTGGGSGGGGGGTEQGSAGSRNGSHEGRNAKPAIPIRGRVFARDLANGVYTVIAEPLKSVKGDVLLTIKAIGDDATGSVVRLSAARGAAGKPLETPRPGVLGPVRFSGKDRLLFDVTLVEPRKLAMEVEAHEAD